MCKYKLFGLSFLVMLAFSACSTDIEEDIQIGKPVEKVLITADDLACSWESRTIFDIDETGNAIFKWVENDTLGIFPSTGGFQVAFPLENISESDAGSALFTGGGWALIEGVNYFSYYPFAYDNRSPKSIPVTYAGQKQSTDNSLEHIGAYDYMYTQGAGATDGQVNFNFHHLGVLLELRVTLPVDETLTAVQLIDPNGTPFVEEGNFDLTASNVVINSSINSNILALSLDDIEAKANQQVTLFVWTAPLDLSGKTLEIRVHGQEKWYTMNRAFSKPYPAGSKWHLTLNKFEEGGEIWSGETKEITPESDIYKVETPAQLAWIAEQVNTGANTFKGKTVMLMNDLELDNQPWTPIGNSTNKFEGTFDGQDKTISNLNIDMTDQSNIGLFGMTTGGEIKNLTIFNADVKGYLSVGVVAGTPYTSKYTDITLGGLIKVEGFSYVGGIGGKNAYADWTNITINASEGSYVKANSEEDGKAYRTYVGGAIGFMGEGGHTVKNVTSNIDVEGSTCDVGGIVGIAHYNNKFENCISSGDVTITNATKTSGAEEIGGIAGVWHNQNGTSVTFTGCSYTGQLSVNYTDGVDLSDNTIVGKPYSADGTGILYINGEQIWPVLPARIGDVKYATIQAAIDDSEGGETIYVEAGQYTEILKVTGGKSLTIQPANEGDEVVIAGVDHQSNSINSSTVLFKNLKFDNSLQTEGWFTGTAKNIKPCVGIWGGNLSFEDCEFMVSGQSGAETGVMTWWTGENKATLNFKNCTFNGLNDHTSARGMQIYGTVDLTVEGCTFNTYKDYSLKYVGQEGTTATFKNNIVNNTENFVELGSSVYPGKNYTVYFETSTLGEGIENFIVANAEGQKVYVDGIEVYPDLGYTVDDSGNITVLKAKGLKAALELAGAAGAGNTTITIADNLDMKDIAWTPISVDGYHGADIVTIEGNNKIITNLAAPLFAGGFAGGSGIVIKDLTIANSTMVSSNTLGSGAFIESADSMDEITLINCHLENSSLKGSRTGGLLGWTAGYNNENDGPVKTYVTIKNCSVVKCEIEGSSVGGIYGHAGNNAWTYSVVENCTVTNCKLNSIDDGGWRVGVIVGTANVGELTITNITESGNTLTQTGKTAPIGEKRNYFGRFVPTTTGKLIIDGVTYVTTADALKQAVSASTTNFYLLDGEYDIDGCGGKTLTISGSKNVIIKVVGGAQGEANGQLDYGFDGSTVTFNGVTIETNNKTYAGYARLNATYNNVTFESCYCLNGTSTFEGCTFNVAGDQYNLWTWGAPEATFTTCVFNSDGKAVLLYGTADTKLTLNQCTFNDTGVLTAKKAAVEIGNDYNKSYELIVNNTTVNGYEINDNGINTGTTLWANKNSMSQDKLNVVVDGVDVY